MSSKSMLLQTPMFQSLHTMTTSPSMGSSNFPFPRHLTPRVVAYLAFGILCSYSLFSNLSPRLNSYSANMNPIHNSTLGFQEMYSTIMVDRIDRKTFLIAAANATGLDFTIRDGVHDAEVESERPPRFPHSSLEGPFACAITHIRTWKHMVQNRITSALLGEGDIDWDPRVKTQLTNFAQASANLTNFVPNTNHPLAYSPPPTGSNISPYGNDWDLLWLGHCGAEGDLFYTYSDEGAAPYHKEYQMIQAELGAVPFGKLDRLPEQRIVTNVRNALCMFAYAVSLRGAFKLADIAADMDAPVDLFLSRRCGDGTLKCVAPWPPIMCDGGHISNMGTHEGERNGRMTGGRTLQYSARVNADRIREGKGIDDWQRNW